MVPSRCMSRKVSLVFLSSPPWVRFPGIVPRVNERRTGCFMPTRLSGGRVANPEGCPENPLRERLEEEEGEEEEGLFKADAVNEEDPERDRATQV